MGAIPASPPARPSTLSWIDTVDSVRRSFLVISPPVVDPVRERAGTIYPCWVGKAIVLLWTNLLVSARLLAPSMKAGTYEPGKGELYVDPCLEGCMMLDLRAYVTTGSVGVVTGRRWYASGLIEGMNSGNTSSASFCFSIAVSSLLSEILVVGSTVSVGFIAG
jgi:hypothetical protein